ncbi:MAG: sulfatase-like hydrolase/transferase [Tannerella sp.]|jgi:arylsulfatase A-like enzyme|nr:sulfatase-like hydrolase/transferase [Tannerella sp.]
MKKLLSLFVCSSCVLPVCAHEKPRPNILLIITDDLGISDLAAYGNASVCTPHIDSLADKGVRCTEAYTSSPISGPSRAGILTGRYQNRFGYEFMPHDHYDKSFMHSLMWNMLFHHKEVKSMKEMRPSTIRRLNTNLPDTEITIAELLHNAGYTTGLVGKWNIGSDLKTIPEEHGYDYSYYFSGALTRYVDDPIDTSRYVNVHLPWAFSELPAWQKRSGPTAIRQGHKEVVDTGYLTFSFAEKAIDFIESNKNNPFFLTLTFNAPHDPFQAPKAYFDRINEKDSVKRVYYAMIEALDDAVGNVIEALKRENLLDNTLIIFTSDNGGATYTRATDNAPLAGGKCTLFDGGLRVPFYIRFPQHLSSVSRVYEQRISTLDIFSTIASVAGVAIPDDRVYDSVDLRPYLTGQKQESPHRELFWRNGYVSACIIDNYKLYILKKDRRIFLFNLESDPSELVNLTDIHPDKVEELKAKLYQWEKAETVKPLWKSRSTIRIDVRGEKYHFPT